MDDILPNPRGHNRGDSQLCVAKAAATFARQRKRRSYSPENGLHIPKSSAELRQEVSIDPQFDNMLMQGHGWCMNDFLKASLGPQYWFEGLE